jgi:hypothetical protein
MGVMFPFMTSYDPPGTSEGTIDPLGLYQIADQLATQLVPAVRERMQRVRFLTAIAVGALVTQGLEDDRRQRDASPYLVWEWLVVEALIRSRKDADDIAGVPGSLVTRRAIDQRGYLDARSYLNTPRIFGFHGIFKRLANRLGLIDVHLGPGPNTEALADAWARGLGFAGLKKAQSLLACWSEAIRRSATEAPPRTKSGWSNKDWAELAGAFSPSSCRMMEKRCLRDLLLSEEGSELGALPAIWNLQTEFDDKDYGEEALHDRLQNKAPHYKPLLRAIRCYEAFARSLQDGFDTLKAVAGSHDTHGFDVTRIAEDAAFTRSVVSLAKKFSAALGALGEVPIPSVSLKNMFTERFAAFAEPMTVGSSALALCTHHEVVQGAKSPEGKRAWFDRLGMDRIYVRHAYREPRRDIQPGRYLHDYRGFPISRFNKYVS